MKRMRRRSGYLMERQRRMAERLKQKEKKGK
jgi:hypothetical protein